MDTYKIGNKINCIIRAYSAGKIGDTTITYDNQPYTILKDISASLRYSSYEAKAKSIGQSEMLYNIDFPNEINFSDILLTDKILNLIYSKNEDKLCHTFENLSSDDEKNIYLNTSASKIYQVFIYDNTGDLETAYGEKTLSGPIAVENANSQYLVCYSYDGTKAVDLNRSNNIYVTLDLEIIGNENDTTSKMWMHLDKCALTADKNLNFSNIGNTVDLTFKILNSNDSSYITLK